ncbi:MAG: hypothetical protein B7Z02_11455 [Rhodobacterales bacterium 32-67-9]|nr:MAG: hypothetical protein B7Z02_11455 [Rhodobacterales bacterium 32-67-9]
MSAKRPPPLHVIVNDQAPYASYLTGHQANLTILAGGREMIEAGLTEAGGARGDGRESLKLAFDTVEIALRSENWFFETVRKKLEETAPLAEFPTIMGANGHDYLLHFTQFLFFLKALDCTSADHIAAFIGSHNARLEEQIGSPDFSKSEKEYRKAIIRPERQAKILDTIRTFNAPIFAIYEYGHLLIDDMSPKTTEKLIEDLRYGKLLDRRIDERMSADQKRILIASNGFLEDTYRISLLMQRRMIAAGLSDAEIAAARG